MFQWVIVQGFTIGWRRRIVRPCPLLPPEMWPLAFGAKAKYNKRKCSADYSHGWFCPLHNTFPSQPFFLFYFKNHTSKLILQIILKYLSDRQDKIRPNRDKWVPIVAKCNCKMNSGKFFRVFVLGKIHRTRWVLEICDLLKKNVESGKSVNTFQKFLMDLLSDTVSTGEDTKLFNVYWVSI